MMIHSIAFGEVIDEQGRCLGFLVTSDWEAQRDIAEVSLDDFLGLMKLAAEDYPSFVQQRWEAKSERWVTWAGHEDHSQTPAHDGSDVLRRWVLQVRRSP